MTLVATVTPDNATDKTVTWSTSDAAVATVNESGVVTAVAAGTATITAKAGEKTATCVVTVNAATVPVTGVTLDMTEISVTSGTSLTLIATVTPENATNKAVTWSSSDEAVVSVDGNGGVTCVTTGSAIVTVTTVDGGKTAICAVTVTEIPVAVTDISLDKDEVIVNVEETATLEATVTPSDATYGTIEWESSDENIVTVAGGVLTGISAGEATITAKAGGKSAVCAVTVHAHNYIPTPNGDGTHKGICSCEDETAAESCVYDNVTIPEYNAAAKNVTYTCEVCEGTVDKTVVEIANAEQLKAFAAKVNEGNSYEGVTIKLTADIVLNNDEPWTPIGNFVNDDNDTRFKGTFDGNSKIISNLNISATDTNNVGLFGVLNGTVQNLTLKNVTVTGAEGVGAVAGKIFNTGLIDNVTVTNVTVSGTHYVGGVAGYAYGNVKNCTVTDADITANVDSNNDNGDKAGGIVGYLGENSYIVTGNKVNDIIIKAYRDLGGIAGIAQSGAAVRDNTVENITIGFVECDSYKDGTLHQNTGAIVGRNQGATIANNASNNVTILVNGDAQLTAVLKDIKKNSDYWNTDNAIVVKLAAGTYSGNHEINQYPEWNGVVGAGNSQNNMISTVGKAFTNIIFKGQDETKFTGNVTVNGNGYAGGGFNNHTAVTTFNNVTFDATNSVEDNNEDYIAMYVVAGANDVNFEGCSFQNATHVRLGGAAADGVGEVSFTGCEFTDGGCLSGYVETLNVTNCNVDGASNGFINNSKAGTVTVTGGEFECGKYFLRTSNSGVEMTVTGAVITMYESEGAKDLVKFRGSNESATFTDCTIADGYTVAGVDANSILTVNGMPYVYSTESLNAALTAGETELNLSKGTYTIPSAVGGKDVTISGDEETVIDLSAATGVGEASLTFNDVTVKTSNADYTGIQHSDEVVYNNVTFDGGTFLYGEKVVFNSCTFDLTTNYLWTYGAKEVEFNDCTFNTAGKAILVYQESTNDNKIVNINGCKFNATQTAQTGAGDDCAAVEIDGSLPNGGTGSFTVNFTGTNIVDDDFAGLYRIKAEKDPSNVTINITA